MDKDYTCLSFNFAPLYLWISSSIPNSIWSYASPNNIGIHYMPGIEKTGSYNNEYNYIVTNVSGRTFTWYLEKITGESNGYYQFNSSGVKYNWIVIG